MKLFVQGIEVPLILSKFPAGESQVRLVNPPEALCNPFQATIEMHFGLNSHIIDLLMLTDAVRRHYAGLDLKLSLRMDYLPYARQDRVCSQGEALGVKVVADLINSQHYERVYCSDIHSDVGVALIDNLVHTTQAMAGAEVARAQAGAVLVSPDAGADQKVFAFAKQYGFTDVLRADKTRDLLTGAITGTGTAVLSKHVGSRDFLILDDICDDGRAFVELARALRRLTTGRIFLFVTHGIFSHGLAELRPHFERIYVSNLVATGRNQVDDPLICLV